MCVSECFPLRLSEFNFIQIGTVSQINTLEDKGHGCTNTLPGTLFFILDTELTFFCRLLTRSKARLALYSPYTYKKYQQRQQLYIKEINLQVSYFFLNFSSFCLLLTMCDWADRPHLSLVKKL